MIRARLLHPRLCSLRLRYIVIPAVLWLVIGAVFLGSQRPEVADLIQIQRQRLFGDGSHVHRMPITSPLSPLSQRIPCLGPRNKLLSDSQDDELQYQTFSDIGN